MEYDLTCKKCGCQSRITDADRAKPSLLCQNCGHVNVPPYRYQPVAKYQAHRGKSFRVVKEKE